METFIYFLKFVVRNVPMLGGAVFGLLIVLIFVLLKNCVSKKTSWPTEFFFSSSVTIFFSVYILMGIIYLLYPIYLSHAEPTVASLGVVIRSGEPLYPEPVGSYPYYGMLYGPVLFEIQAVFQWFSKLPTIVTSKLPGLLALVASAVILMRINKNWLYRGYLLYLFPFGLMLFWNRAEPFLIFTVSISIIFGKNYTHSKYLPIFMGIIGGVASAMKMHGAAYIFAAYLAVVLSAGVSIYAILLFLISAAFSFLVFFAPQNVSFFAFWSYLKLGGTHHGLSLRLWLENIIYLVFLLLPFIIFWRDIKFKANKVMNLTFILAIEFCITVIAAKNGAGFYHLLPFVPINLFIFQKIYTNGSRDSMPIKVLYLSLIVASFSVLLLDLVLPMAKSWQRFNEAKKEVIYFESKYPNIVMGITDDNGYPYTFFRAMMRGGQIDYNAFMDWQTSGIGDDTLVENFKNCKIRYVLLPNVGSPFSMNNYYTFKSLFSDNVRNTFNTKYSSLESKKYYSLYTCFSLSEN